MLVDSIILMISLGALFTGFRRGFLRSLLSTLGYIGGGVLGLWIALRYSEKIESDVYRIGVIVLAIFVAGEMGRRVFGAMAKYFRTRILWAPLKFIDSLAGSALELARTALITYLVISILLWSPWPSVRSAINESSIYPRVAKELPVPAKQLRSEIEKRLSLTLPT
jgi:uncharacterized membrane protein required for colicin V production